jgi:ankyrin repeat protein
MKSSILRTMTEQEFVALAKAGDTHAVRSALESEPALANAKDNGVSALLWAVYYGHAPVGRVIADARKGKIDIFEATALGDEHELKRLVQSNPSSVNDYSADGFTPLGLAAFFGHRETAQQLIAAGADPTLASKNPLGVIPLHSALAGGHKEIARDLIESGNPALQVNTPNKEGWFPLHYAAHSGDRETADFLMMKGASTSQVNNIGETAAMEARKHGHDALAEILE